MSKVEKPIVRMMIKQINHLVGTVADLTESGDPRIELTQLLTRARALTKAVEAELINHPSKTQQ